MGQDANEIVPKGEIPTEAEFARLLCDRAFVDYLNTFLSLPVFSQRLLYKFSEQIFELDPPIKRTQYRVDRVKLMRWVRTKRAPFFFRSDLYLEYLLSKHLQKTQLHLVFSYGTDNTSAKDKIMDHCLMTRWLGRVSGMRKFRRFIARTAGENSVQFWLDAERFRRTGSGDEDQKWASFYAKMEARYFKCRDVSLPGAALLQQYQSSIPSSTESDALERPLQLNMNRETFIIVQGFILKTLQNYWVPRYLVHCKQHFTRYPRCASLTVYRPNCYAVRVRSLSEISANDESEGGSAMEQKTSDVRSHHSIRKLQLKRQSVGNLMSMFTSSRVRRSELSTLLKVEDIGETVKGAVGAESGDEADGELEVKAQDWLTDEFPLPSITEESANYQRTPSASPTRASTRASPPRSHLSSTSSSSSSESDVVGSQASLLRAPSRGSRRSSRRSSARRSTTPQYEPPRPTSALADSSPQQASPSPAHQQQPEEQKEDADNESQRPTSRKSAKRTSSGRRSRRGSGAKSSSRRVSSSRRGSGVDMVKERDDQEAPLEETEDGGLSSSDESLPAPASEAVEKGTTSPKHSKQKSPPAVKQVPEADTMESSIVQNESRETESEKDEPKSDMKKHDDKHRGNIADLHKYRRSSDASNKSSSTESSSTSVSHSSVSSGSHISLSKRRMSMPASGALPRPPGVAKPPRRRARPQSVEFRFGDFSLFVDKEEPNKRKGSSSSRESLKELKLEADLIALQGLQQEREKRKKERLKQRRAAKKKPKKQKKEAQPSELPILDEFEAGNDASTLMNTLKKLAMRRKGTATPLVKVNRSAFQKLEALHNMSVSDREKHDKHIHSQSKARRAAKRQESMRKYSDLSFEEKLREDDRRLMLVSNLPEALEVMHERAGESEGIIPRKSEALPSISGQKFTLQVTKPHLIGYNLGEAKYRERNKLIVSAVLSDKIAGHPWTKFLKRYSYTNELRYLHFWHTAQEYIDADRQFQGTTRDRVRHKFAIKLITNFLKALGERAVRLGRLLTAELVVQLSGSGGDELLMHAQDLACEALQGVWTVYQRHDMDSFLSRTSERKNAQQRAYPLCASPMLALRSGQRAATGSLRDLHDTSKSPTTGASPTKDGPSKLSQVLADARKSKTKAPSPAAVPVAAVGVDEELSKSVAPYRVVRAVHLTSKSHFGDRTDSDSDEPSDPDEDSDDEGSLRRKGMVVYRTRKVESTLTIKGSKKARDRTPGERAAHISRAKRIIGEALSPLLPERDQETAKTVVCRAIRKGGKTIHRPSRPRSFMEVLHEQSHFEFFRRYLQVEVGSELPLSFWQSVEQLRMGNTRDPKVRQAKAQAIVKKYFNKTTNYGADLQTDADIINDIPTMEKITPQMLLSAQTCVAKSMEEKWYDNYRESYTEDASEDEAEATSQTTKFGQEGRTKYLWGIFISNVCQFRRGLMTPWLLSLFKEYLGKEVQRDMEKQRVSGIVTKKIIGGKVVVVDKLQNDLCFWAEVERFKQLADNAARAAAAGTYTLEDEEYVQKKATAIIDVFLDSFVPPRVQINVPPEIAEEIIDIAQHGIIERGLFHDAALHTFTVLLYCWKKFTKDRLSYKPTSAPSSVTIAGPPPQTKPVEYLAPGEFGPPRPAAPPKKKPKKKKKPSTPMVCGVKIKTIVGAVPDDPPRMFFTVESGLQLILPPKPLPDHEPNDWGYRNLMRTLINSGHEEGLLQLFQQPAALGLGLAQQRRLSRTLALQFPALLKTQETH